MRYEYLGFAIDRSTSGHGSSSTFLDEVDSRLWRKKKLWANKAPGKMIITL
jgi:hypothetical protein